MGARIGRPCGEAWSAMPTVQGGRHCAACDRTVVDLVGMSEARAMALAIFSGPRGMCGHALTDGLGNVIFRRAPRRDRSLVVLAAGALAASGCGASPNPEPIAVAHPVAPSTQVCRPEDKVLALEPVAASKTSAPVSNDDDGDGVLNDDDKCPEDAGDASTDGCPGPRRVIISSSGDLVILPQVYFTWGRAGLGPDADALLDEVAQTMKAHAEIVHLDIQGHTDSTEGGAAALSKRRAQAVVDALVQRGVEPARLAAVGLSATQPLDPGSSGEAREKNRRVGFHVETP